MRNKKARQNNGGAVEASAPLAENDIVQSIKAVTEFPRSSFEFYVWSDEGVNLQVDLTSSPSDWTNKFKNEVRVSDDVNVNKSRSFRQDLLELREKSPFLWNTDYCQIFDRDGQAKSSSSGLKLTKGVTELFQQKNGERPLMSYSVIPCSISDRGKLELQHSKPDNQCSGNCGLPNGSCIVNPGLVCAGASLSSSVEAAKIVNGKMHSRCSRLDDRLKKSSLDSDVHVSKTELRKKKRNRYSDIQGSSTLATRILRSMKKTAVMILPSSSVELQNSEAACCHKYASVSPCDNNETLDLKAPKNTCEMEQYGLLKSSEINKVTDKNDYPSQTEEWEVAKIVDGRMRSRCSQFDDPLTKSSLDSDDQVSKTEHRKKRKNRYSKIQGSSTPATRILRSRSKTVVTVLPSSSPELQNSDVANCQKHALVSPCDNDGSLDFSERKKTSEMEHDGLLNSSEINFVIDGNNYSSQPEEREAAKVVDGRKRPGQLLLCSQLDDPLKKSSLDSDDQVSKSKLHIKRENIYSEIQGSSTPATRILRSMTKTAAAVLPSSSLELQNSEVVSCHKHASVSPCDNDGSLDLSEPKNTSEMEQHGLLNSSEINIVTDRNNYTSQPEEWEAAKIVEGRTRSRCSQFVDPLNKSCLDSDDQVSKTELRKKRENRYSEIQGSSTPATRILRSMTKTAAVLPSCSPELQNSEVASCHKYPLVSSCDNDGSLDLSNPKNTSEMEQDRLLNSSEINFVTDGNNYLSQTEEWEVVKVVDGKERLGCSQFDDPHKKSSLDSDDQVSKTKLLKKRKNSYSEIQASCGKPTTRMSRSMTKTAVLGRRSPRLISK